MSTQSLFDAIAGRDAVSVRRLLATDAPERTAWVQSADPDGMTPLMRAVRLRDSCEIVGALLDAGADVAAVWRGEFGPERSVLSLALDGGDPAVVVRLLDAGADLHYDRDGYSALLDAVHGRELLDDPKLLPLLTLLIDRGAGLDAITRWQESGLRVLSRVGRFDAVALLLAAGADAVQLGWSKLHHAVAFGDVLAVRARLDAGGELEARDFWSRTPFHLAVVRGDLAIMSLLRSRGADTKAAARCGQRPLALAAGMGHSEVVADLLRHGAAVDAVDDFGKTALLAAAEHGRIDAIRTLVAGGAQLDFQRPPTTTDSYPPELAEALKLAVQEGEMTGALEHTTDLTVARWLLDAGADPQRLDFEVRRALLGLSAEEDRRHLQLDPAAYARGRSPRFGSANPERIAEPFWLAMIRAGCTAFAARERFDDDADVCGEADPVWCAQRFGQSISFLDDGRIVQIGGEHEDGYDPDFCIYNDVFVHEPDGSITVYGYPQAVFPPTDFHSATVVGEQIILIGRLGYDGQRQYGTTPVYALDLRGFGISRIDCEGDAPGWLYKHHAVRIDEGTIEVSGGYLLEWIDGKECKMPMQKSYRLDLGRRLWSRAQAE